MKAQVFASPLFLAILTLLGFGLIQVYSSSFVLGIESFEQPHFFFYRQLMFAGVGLGLLLFVLQIPFSWIKNWSFIFFLAALISLAATLIPGVGLKVGGATRWIPITNSFRFEPSEFLKLGFVLFLAALFLPQGSIPKRMPWFVTAALLISMFALLYHQPDFGTFSLLLLLSICFLFVVGLKKRVFLTSFIFLIPAFYFLLMSENYRRTRVLAFLDPWSEAEKSGFQVIQSMLSFSSGGLFGSGIGQSQGKLFFLPEAHTDFTLAIFGEEFGWVGFVVLMCLYGIIIFQGFRIALKSKDPFKKNLSLGISILFALQVFTNCGVVLGMLPTKGLTLPFLSYGGSSLITLCVMMALLLKIQIEENNESKAIV